MAILRMADITKRYDNGILANDGASLSLERGEIHAVAGENGAGKSTIMKILYGMERPDRGVIELDGKPVEIHSPKDAMALGIGMVHQHFMLVDELPVYENVFLGREPGRPGRMDRAAMIQKTRELGETYGMPVDPLALCGGLPVGVLQKVEMLKVLARGARILVLDEPTAVLTPQETAELFNQLRLLRASGCTTVIITHKLKEILELCDRVTVMRAGRTMGTWAVEGLTREELTRQMVGRDVALTVDKSPAEPGEAVLAVAGLTVAGPGGKPAVRGVSFTVRAGEILCLAGVEGNGQREVVRCVTGLHRRYDGEIRLAGQSLAGRDIRAIRDMGLAHIPEDRMVYGVSAGESILDNLISLDVHRESGLGPIPYGRLTRRAAEQISRYGVKAAGPAQPIGMLSGGNMQKVVAAREMDRPLALLVADQPTRGVDVGAMAFIHSALVRLRDEGRGVLLISADMGEVFALADRILVFHEGEITAEITDMAGLSEQQLGRYMLGVERMRAGDGHG